MISKKGCSLWTQSDSGQSKGWAIVTRLHFSGSLEQHACRIRQSAVKVAHLMSHL